MYITCTNRAVHPGFETQRTHHQKSKTGVSVAPKKDVSTKFFFKKIYSDTDYEVIERKKKFCCNDNCKYIF